MGFTAADINARLLVLFSSCSQQLQSAAGLLRLRSNISNISSSNNRQPKLTEEQHAFFFKKKKPDFFERESSLHIPLACYYYTLPATGTLTKCTDVASLHQASLRAILLLLLRGSSCWEFRFSRSKLVELWAYIQRRSDRLLAAVAILARSAVCVGVIREGKIAIVLARHSIFVGDATTNS